MESLERRETPGSAAGGLHHLAAQASTTQATAAHRTSIAFQGSGGGSVVSATTTNIAGHATHLGAFTGTITGLTASTTPSTATADLVATNGSQIALNLTGSLNHSRTPLINGSFPIYSGTLRFTITGGTNEFASATGTGLLDAKENSAFNGLVFHFHGRLSLPSA